MLQEETYIYFRYLLSKNELLRSYSHRHSCRTTWKLYSGPSGDTTVYSFVASSEVNSVSDDLFELYIYLVSKEGFSSSQYIQSVELGTEPFTGTDGQLTATLYTVSIN